MTTAKASAHYAQDDDEIQKQRQRRTQGQSARLKAAATNSKAKAKARRPPEKGGRYDGYGKSRAQRPKAKPRVHAVVCAHLVRKVAWYHSFRRGNRYGNSTK